MANELSKKFLKDMEDALAQDGILQAQLTQRINAAPMQGLPGGEGATQLHVNVMDWSQVDPEGMMPLDRHEWPPGPWHDEANALWYEEGGAYGVVLRNPTTGTLCGYVGITADGPAEAHGGITHTGPMPMIDITHTGPMPMIDRALGLPQGERHWLGFDTCHYDDVMPKLLAAVGRGKALNSKATYKDLRWMLHHVELLRRRLCIPRVLLTEPTWAQAFRFVGELNDMVVQKSTVVDLDVTPPAKLHVLVDRSDVREVIHADYATIEPTVDLGYQCHAVGVFRMHSGALMLLTAGTVTNWEPVHDRPKPHGGGVLTRDLDTMERELRQRIRTNSEPLASGPLTRALIGFNAWRANLVAPPPTRAEMDAVATALAEAENAFDLDP